MTTPPDDPRAEAAAARTKEAAQERAAAYGPPKWQPVRKRRLAPATRLRHGGGHDVRRRADQMPKHSGPGAHRPRPARQPEGRRTREQQQTRRTHHLRRHLLLPVRPPVADQPRHCTQPGDLDGLSATALRRQAWVLGRLVHTATTACWPVTFSARHPGQPTSERFACTPSGAFPPRSWSSPRGRVVAWRWCSPLVEDDDHELNE